MTFAPAVQVLITTQFSVPTKDLNTLEIGEIFHKFSSEFPHYGELAPAGPMPFSLAQLSAAEPASFTIEAAPRPRVRLTSDDGAYSFLFQHDRISFGWQREKPERETSYPGFDELIRSFLALLERFSQVVTDKDGNKLAACVSEVAYVNYLRGHDDLGNKRRLSSIFKFLNPEFSYLVNGYSYSWNELMSPQEGVLVVQSNGPFHVEEDHFSRFALTGTFQISNPENIAAELQQARRRVGSTFERALSALARTEY